MDTTLGRDFLSASRASEPYDGYESAIDLYEPATPSPRESRDREAGWQAWLCVIGAFTFIIPSYGFMHSIGTVQSFLHLNQLSMYSIGEVGWITGMYLFLSYFFNIMIGPICDSYGPMILGPIGFMLCLGVFGAIGGAAVATIAMSILAKVFIRRRGLAMGVALTGSSVGSIVFPIMLQSTLPRLGWKWSMRIIAFVVAGITAMGLLCFLPYSNSVLVQRSSGTRIVRNLFNFSAFQLPSFLFVSLGLFLLEFAIFAIAGLLPTLATGAGFSPGGGYTLIAILSSSSCVGRILPGLVGDIIGPFNVILAMTALTLLFMGALFIPFAESSRLALYAFSALWGFGSGSFLSIAPVCMGATCETRNFGRFYGTMTFVVSFGVLFSVPLSGIMLEKLGTQPLASLLTAIVFLGGVCYTTARGLVSGKWLSFQIRV